MTLLAFNKPYGVLCQFSGGGARPTLADFVNVANVYPAGRLDQDSEGLLLLTDDGALQAAIADPRSGIWKRYLVQVERVPAATALEALSQGVVLEGRRTRAARARLATQPEGLWPRDPPIRYRKNVPTSWLEIEIHEGRNRQVRRMTAAVGHPTLRLIRMGVGSIDIDGLAPGTWREINAAEIAGLTRGSASRSPEFRPHPRRATPRAGK